MAELIVRPLLVVLGSEIFDDDVGLGQGPELLSVEALVAEAAMEGFHEAALPGTAGGQVFPGRVCRVLRIARTAGNFVLAQNLVASSFNTMVKCQSTSLDRTFAALSDPTRRGLLSSLSRGETCVTDLARPFRISLPAVSRHLSVLEAAGLLTRQRHGREHHLQLNSAPMKEAVQWIETYRTFWEGTLDSLAAYLENPIAVKKLKRETKA